MSGLRAASTRRKAHRQRLWVKLDVDIGYSEVLAELVRIAKDIALESLGMKVIVSHVTESPKSGNMHYRALVEPPVELEPQHLAFIQAVVGDDPMRAKLNIIRAKDWKSYSKRPFGWNTLAIAYLPEGVVKGGERSESREGHGV